MSNDANEKIDALKNAASAMMVLGLEQFKAGQPDVYAEFRAAFDAGGMECGVTAKLVPELVIEIWATNARGERHPIITLETRVAGGAGKLLN
jgi:hypothetical protein